MVILIIEIRILFSAVFLFFSAISFGAEELIVLTFGQNKVYVLYIWQRDPL